ncbi:protein regulator of cytokinesis 1 [Neodiprion lecontei]|uniref:Protein regulator of cytokinesis 1 n=1 Tax=Neodiprion lecontei TaxID=441921 RepID=A0ABM3GE88_NEOLC|nr:protein regulator of cytokinesis 1 [Neodiprion lecontei]XP_046598558.1 protein regulator of cytokinesis 1 [Neodiprion lecontei]XP_046598566.1 protein regulator of cytokinesis 1 [Neodiprion lecontei]
MADLRLWELKEQMIYGSIKDFMAEIASINDVRQEMNLRQFFGCIQDMGCCALAEIEQRRIRLAKEVHNMRNETLKLGKDLKFEIKNGEYKNLSLYGKRVRLREQLESLKSDQQKKLDAKKELLEKEKEICKVLGSKPIGMAAVIPTETDLTSFRLYLAGIEAEKQEAEKKRNQLKVLWNYLDVPAKQRDEFLDRNKRYTASTRKAIEDEIKRCEQQKSEIIASNVSDLRSQIEVLWKLCHFEEEDREAFKPFHDQTFTEDLLMLHEEELQRLHKYYETNRKLFQLAEEQDERNQELIDLEQRAESPDRYYTRRDERDENEQRIEDIQQELLNIENQLKFLVDDYETKNGGPCTRVGIKLVKALRSALPNALHVG